MGRDGCVYLFRKALTLEAPARENRGTLIMILLEKRDKEYDLPTGQAGVLVAADRLTLEVPDGEIFGLAGAQTAPGRPRP